MFERAELESGVSGLAGEVLLDTKQVAELLNVSESWVREHSSSKEPRLPAIKLGEGKTCLIRFHPDDIRRFVSEQRERARQRHVGRRWRN